VLDTADSRWQLLGSKLLQVSAQRPRVTVTFMSRSFRSSLHTRLRSFICQPTAQGVCSLLLVLVLALSPTTGWKTCSMVAFCRTSPPL
jgi:hypothetical protein